MTEPRATCTPSRAASTPAPWPTSRARGRTAERGRAPRADGGGQRRRPRRVRRGGRCGATSSTSSGSRRSPGATTPWSRPWPQPGRPRRCGWRRSASTTRACGAGCDEWYDALDQVLDRVEGRMEWSVKASLRPAGRPRARSPAEDRRPAGRGVPPAQEGRAPRRGSSADEAAAPGGRRDPRALSAASVASRRLPPQDPRLTGHEGTMVLNGAYLVDVDDGGRLSRPRSSGIAAESTRGATSSARARGRRTPSRCWSSDERPSPERSTSGRRRPSARSPWSTCSTGCSAPAWCWPGTS